MVVKILGKVNKESLEYPKLLGVKQLHEGVLKILEEGPHHPVERVTDFLLEQKLKHNVRSINLDALVTNARLSLQNLERRRLCYGKGAHEDKTSKQQVEHQIGITIRAIEVYQTIQGKRGQAL